MFGALVHAVYQYSGAASVVDCVTHPGLSSCAQAAVTVVAVVGTGGEAEVEIAAADVAEEEAANAGRNVVEDAAASCGGASFTAATEVLLASGAVVPVAQLKAGEKVLATNVKTGTTQPEAVTAVMVHHDTGRYDLKVTAHGKTSVIGTTSSHLFWVPATRGHHGRWVKAAALRHGTRLRTPAGRNSATVVSGWVPRQRDGWMWDLTIPGGNDHDFYINTVAADVLVHNCPDDSGTPGSLKSISDKELKKILKRHGTEPHEFKAWFVGKVSRFDVKSRGGMLYIVSKDGRVVIPTGYSVSGS